MGQSFIESELDLSCNNDIIIGKSELKKKEICIMAFHENVA